MSELISPESVRLNYQAIKDFAEKFNQETKIGTVFDLKQILELFGGNIAYLNMTEIESGFFMKVFGKNSFLVNIPNSISKDFERFLLAQALGHYILHSKSGEVPCVIQSISKTNLAKEAIWFALELLLPEEKFLNNIDTIDDDALAKLYRVPSFAIEMKKKIINNVERESK